MSKLIHINPEPKQTYSECSRSSNKSFFSLLEDGAEALGSGHPSDPRPVPGMGRPGAYGHVASVSPDLGRNRDALPSAHSMEFQPPPWSLPVVIALLPQGTCAMGAHQPSCHQSLLLVEIIKLAPSL